MGHARECWCDSFKEARQAQELADSFAALDVDTAVVEGIDYSSFALSAPGETRNEFAATISRSHSEVYTESSNSDSDSSVRCLSIPSASDSQAAPLVQTLSCTPPDPQPTLDPFAAKTIIQKRASSPGTTLNDSEVSYERLDSEKDFESDFSDYDAVVLTPSSSGASSEFEGILAPSSEGMNFYFDDLEVIEGVPVDSDDDWSDLSPGLHIHRLSSFLSSPTVSDASVQTSNSPLVASSPPVAPSPPRQTPSSWAHQVSVSDAGNETE